MLQFRLFLLIFYLVIVYLVIFYFCYLLSWTVFVIFYLGLFLLSLVDNHYVDKTLVYKVVSYT